MSLLRDIDRTIRKVGNMTKTKLRQSVTGVPEELPGEKENRPDEVAAYVVGLWKDSVSWREQSFRHSRDDRYGYDKPMEFWRACSKLESGNHYDVFGHRVDDSEESKWKQELVDDEIQQQIRIKAQYINGNWHDVTIAPNVEYINEVFDQERHATGWGKNIRRLEKTASIYGEAWLESTLDTTIQRNGLVREYLLMPWQVFRTPYSETKEFADGCNYIIIADVLNQTQVEKEYPDLDLDEMATMTADRARTMILNYGDIDKPYDMTKSYDRLRCYIDDDELEEVPYTDAETQIEHATMVEGGEIAVHKIDNHKEHIRAHEEWINGLSGGEITIPEEGGPDQAEDAQVNILRKIVQHHIEDHKRMAAREGQVNKQGDPNGKREKYPNGRLIIVVGDMLAFDKPNPYKIGWRNLFNQLKNEDLPYRIDGRGDVEILWQTNKGLDMALSRIADIGIAAGIPKQWFKLEDKEHVQGNSNDPTKPGFYTQTPPVFRQATLSPDTKEIYNAFKANASKNLGANKTVYGNSPTTNSSNKLAETLLRQSELLITGEINVNLNDLIEDVVETRIMLWRQFYTDPRPYFIHGKKKFISLASVLRTIKVEDEKTGQVTEEEITKFEITVRPNSNFPNRWENAIDFLIQLVEVKDSPPELKNAIWFMIMDLLSEKFPELEMNGKYLKLGKATQVGLQQMQQEQQQQEGEQKDRDSIEKRLKGIAMKKMFPGATKKEGEPTNGAAIAGAAEPDIETLNQGE